MNNANDISKQIDDIEKDESGYTFDSILKLILKLFKYNDIRASSYCKLPKACCSSKSIVNI